MATQLLCAVAIATLACAALVWTPPAKANSETTIVYVAPLHALNKKVTGVDTAGEARFSITGDSLTISVNAQNLPPDTMHLQHFHGFSDNRDAACPTEAVDVNRDGIIDLIETEPASGTTMVPFHDDPVSMEIVRDTYPNADADGTFQYRKTVPLKDLDAAFGKAFGDNGLDLDRRVVFIHGTLESTKLPASAASLGTIPAQVTLPIACGEIERARQ